MNNEAYTDPIHSSSFKSLCTSDPPPEVELSPITRLIARLLRVPIAVISLIDVDQQFIKSHVGLNCDLNTKLPLVDSISRQVINKKAPIIIERISDHADLCASAEFLELKCEAYLGVPLTTREGFIVGLLWAADPAPRTWTKDDCN